MKAIVTYYSAQQNLDLAYFTTQTVRLDEIIIIDTSLKVD